MNEYIQPIAERMVTPDTKTFWRSLAAIPWSRRGEIRTKLVPWIYTNDHQFSAIMPDLVAAIHQQHRGDRPRVAVLSGVGSILNVAPYLEVDCIVSVDRNSFVLDQVRRMVENVRDAQTLTEYQHIDQQQTFFTDLKAMEADPEPYWEMERSSFGPWHFQEHDSNYQATRRALLQTPVFYTQGNFVHGPYVAALGKSLSHADISYASFTDLAEWSPEFLECVGMLPVSSDGVIAWSTNQGQPEGKPVARLSIGLPAYIAQQQEQLSGLTVDYFTPHV